MKQLQAGATIGFIGGGQLARMMCDAAARLGFRSAVLDPDAGCPAARIADDYIAAAYDDRAGLDRLAGLCDVITYEFENIPATAVDYLASSAVVLPQPAALEVAQDRFLEKKFLNECDIATAQWRLVDDQESLAAALAACGGSGILKTRRLGYDGKGQVRITQQNEDAARRAWQEIGQKPAIFEGFVDFSREISVIAARAHTGEVVFFDIPENLHHEGILRRSTVPAAVSTRTAAAAQAATATILHALDYIGVIAVEFFVKADGSVIANEFAPRVHNSGHWTEAACVVSQFEQHIRAVAGLPLGQPARHSNCMMQNLIGDDVHRIADILQEAGAFIHLYGKAEVRPGRKMGHVVYINRS